MTRWSFLLLTLIGYPVFQKRLTRSPWTIHTPRQSSLVVSVWRRERPRRAVTSLSPQAASWPISPEPTNPGRPSPRADKQSVDLMTQPQTGKLRSPAPAAVANPTIVRSSLLSASTVPNNRPSSLRNDDVGTPSTTEKLLAGCSKSSSSKAAASEDPMRTLCGTLRV